MPAERRVMRDFDEHNITDAVIASLAQTKDARLKTVMTSLVRHLHDFVRDVDLSFDEWYYAVEFLTRTGQMSGDKRQEPTPTYKRHHRSPAV